MESQEHNIVPLFKVLMSSTIDEPLLKVLHSGYIGQGQKVEEFEFMLKEYFGRDYIITLNTGTSGLHLALYMYKKKLGLDNNSEILTTPLTCFATNAPILTNDLKIKWVDIDPGNLNIDLDDLARKITPNTKIIIFVHWGGYPIDEDKLNKICNDTEKMYGFRPVVIEDGAHALGSEYDGRKLGNQGNIIMYSLQAIKHVTSIDGGIVIFQNKEDYQRAKLMRWYGISREEDRTDMRCELNIKEAGFKFHMNDVNAVIGMENFKDLDKIVAMHRDNAKYYDDNLADVGGIILLERNPLCNSSFWLYTMLVENRPGFMRAMKERGIMVSRVHERNDIHTAVKEFRVHLPSLDRVHQSMICIPVGWWVTKEDREYIVKSIKEGW